MSAFDDVIAEAVAWFVEHGFKNEEEYRAWERRISEAIDAKMRSPGMSDRLLKEHLEAIFSRLVQQGTILKYHGGVKKFTIDRVAPHLRAELTKRIMASADYIKLNRQKMRQETLKRFAGWATSVPTGGPGEADKRKIKAEIAKPLKSLPFTERRVLIDQGHKLNASISAVIAKDAGAIAGRWFSHWRQANYNYREDHKERDGLVYLIRDSWAAEKGYVKVGPAGWADAITQPAEEPFCFPGESRVPFADGVERAFRHWFDGELTEVITETGVALKATPNHPVLTPLGWKAIGSLNLGDEIIEIADKRFSAFGKDQDDRVSRIDEIFGTIEKSGVKKTLDLSPAAFHGDGSNGQVDIVTAARSLRFGRKPTLFERAKKLTLSVADSRRSFSRYGRPTLLCMFDAAQRLVRVLCQSLTPRFSLALHSDGVGLGYRSGFDARLLNAGFDDHAGGAESFGEGQNAFSGLEGGNHFSWIENKTTLSRELWEAERVELPSDGLMGHPEKDSNLNYSFPFSTKAAKVVGINRSRWAGHVYNLQTREGWYVTQNVVTHNCRCKWTYLYHLRQLPDDMLTKAGRDALEKSRLGAAA